MTSIPQGRESWTLKRKDNAAFKVCVTNVGFCPDHKQSQLADFETALPAGVKLFQSREHPIRILIFKSLPAIFLCKGPSALGLDGQSCFKYQIYCGQ